MRLLLHKNPVSNYHLLIIFIASTLRDIKEEGKEDESFSFENLPSIKKINSRK